MAEEATARTRDLRARLPAKEDAREDLGVISAAPICARHAAARPASNIRRRTMRKHANAGNLCRR